MVRRILRSIYAVGLDKPQPASKVDMAQNNATALEVARQGAVLLKNDGVLPLTSKARNIAVIGGFARAGGAVGQRFEPGYASRWLYSHNSAWR